MPLDEHIEGGHGEREPGVKIGPDPVHDLFARTIRPKARIALSLNVVMMRWWALSVHHRNA